MTSVPYLEIHDWEKLVLHLANGMRVEGRYTGLRVRHETVPKSYHVYEIRHSDEGGDMCQLKTHVLVNHDGTFVCRRSIPEAFFGVEIIDYAFEE